MSSMTITERDLHQMLNISRDYCSTGESGDSEALPWDLLRELKELVPCDNLSASGQDTPRWEFFNHQELPWMPTTPAEEQAADAAYRAHYWDSTCSYPDRAGDPTVVFRCSDMMSDADYHQTGMYADHDRPFGVEHEIMVCLDAGAPQRTLRLLFARGPGSDFSDRDLAVLTLLRPHLQNAYVAAQRRQRGLLPLTPRQQEILRYVSAGFSNGQIARRLDISEGTVGKHMENIFERLHVGSRAAAVARLNPSL